MSTEIHPRVAAINAKVAAGGTLTDLDSDFLNYIGNGLSPEEADKLAVVDDSYIPAPHLPLATLFARKGPTTMDTPFVRRGAISPPLFIAGDYDGNVAFVKSSHFYLRRKRGPGRGRVTHRVVHPPFFTIDSFSDIHI